MNRRDFLTRVLGGAAAALLLPQIDLLAASLPPSVAEALDGPVWLKTFAAVHDEAFRIWRERMLGSGFTVECVTGEHRIGHIVAFRDPAVDLIQPVTLTHQFSAMCRWGDIREDALSPAIASLVAQAAYTGADMYGQMPVPFGCDYAEHRYELRQVVAYDISRDIEQVRWDVLGGASPVGERIARRYRQNELKTHIKRRLARPRFRPQLPA